MTGSKPPPHDTGAEEALLGAAMLSSSALEVLANDTDPSDFYSPANSSIAGALCTMWLQGNVKVDPVLLADELKRNGLLEQCGGLPELVSIMGRTPATSNAARYASIVREKGRRRRLGAAGASLQAAAFAEDDDAERAALRLASAAHDNPDGAATGILRAADVSPERVRWLWPGRIPLGKVTVLDGDPGLGKSTLTLDLGARVSTGSPMPTGERRDGPAGVVLLSAEDGVADTIRPRLEAAGADLTRVVVFDHLSDSEGTPRPPSIPADLTHVEAVVCQEEAALVVVDPLMAFLAANVDAHRDQDVRRALHGLARMAEATGAAVVVLRHLSKSGGAHPIYRGGGSIGIIGAARAALLVAPDPDDDTRRVLAVTKSNLAAMPEALAYRLVTDDLHGAARVVWEGTSSHTATDLLVLPEQDGGSEARSEAAQFLLTELAGGPQPAMPLRQRAEKEAGIALRTLDRAKKRLGVVSQKVGQPGNEGQRWMWSLPDRDAPGDVAPPPKDATSPPKDAEERHPKVVGDLGDHQAASEAEAVEIVLAEFEGAVVVGDRLADDGATW